MRCIYFLISGLVDGNMSEGGIFPLLLDLFNFFELFLELLLGINLFLLDAWACPVSPSLHLLIFFIFVLLVQLVLIFHNFFHLKLVSKFSPSVWKSFVRVWNWEWKTQTALANIFTSSLCNHEPLSKSISKKCHMAIDKNVLKLIFSWLLCIFDLRGNNVIFL